MAIAREQPFRLVGVNAEDPLIAALRVKAEHLAAAVTYARHANKRGDARHLARKPASEGR